LGRLLLPELNRVSFTRSAPSLTRRATAAIDRLARARRPFFLLVKYHVTHLPYSASHPYDVLYREPGYRGRNLYRIDFAIDAMIQRGFDHDLSEGEIAHIRNLYDGCVREFDDQVGAIVRHLAGRGLLEHTIVGVVSDHGDDLYEHGTTLGHGVTLFGGDHANRIPAVFAGPGIASGRVENKLVRSHDLAPTWMRWLGLEAPAAWQGVDLSGPVPDLTAVLETSYLLYRQPIPDLKPGETPKVFPRFDHATFIDETFDLNLVLKDEFEDDLLETKCFAVRKGRWKLIHVPGENGPIRRLFDLELDRECRRDVRAEHAELFAELAALLPPEAGP
jgi:arylsulfatase A-like enzyme